MRLSRRQFRLFREGVVKNQTKVPTHNKLSFYLVIAFFGIFGLIILVEVFFTDDSSFLSITHMNLLNDDTQEDSQEVIKRREILPGQQEVMEGLIRNISSKLLTASNAKSFSSTKSVPKSNVYLPNESGGPFDFKLKGSMGKDGVWQPVNGTSHRFYVYSGYIDNRGNKSFLRVIAVTKTHQSDSVYCKMYYKKPLKGAKFIIPAQISIIRENWNFEYTAAFLMCPIKGKHIPDSVSIISSKSLNPNSKYYQEISNQIRINEAVKPPNPLESSKIGACIKPFHYNFGKTLDLVEFIELNRILGVTKFTFYNHTTTQSVSCVLNYYIQKNIASVLPWKLRINSKTEIRTEGIFASLNDCLYRQMRNFKYLMFIDLDEYIIPQKNHSLIELLNELNQQNLKKRTISSYSFQNSFFYMQFPDDSSADSTLRIFRKTRRKAQFNPQNQRSKYICTPSDVKEVGNHFVWEFMSIKKKSFYVPTNVAYMHHYRICEFGGNDCVKGPSVIDRKALRYKDLLHKNIEKTIESLKEKCPSVAKSLKSSFMKEGKQRAPQKKGKNML